jgi:hypothetical protein
MKKSKNLKNKYRVFVRNWWKENKDWPNGLEPDSTARKTYISDRIETEDQAREVAQEYNKTHNPGRLSRKAEFELY